MAKYRRLKFTEREEIVVLMEQGNLLDIVDHPVTKYQHQKMFVVDVKGYVYLVPFVAQGERYFLKTIFASRKATKEYLKEGGGYEAR